MARTPEGAQPRTTFLNVRLTEDGRHMVDLARGQASASTYVRRLISEDCERRQITLEEPR